MTKSFVDTFFSAVAQTFTAALAAMLSAGTALATEPSFPFRPVTLIVPFPPGGTTDVVTRAIGQSLARELGQQVIVDNKAGAAGTVGASQVLRSLPDGYTLLMGGLSDQVTSYFLIAKPPYNPARDFEPVACLMRFPNLLVVNPKLPAQSVAELVQLAKKEPGKINFASGGNGNPSHLSGELFAQAAGIDITHVPYRGNAPAITDIIGGQVQMMFTSPPTVLQFIKSGMLRVVAVTSSARLPELPNVPTLRESGLPVENYSWGCVMVPAKTPSSVVDTLNAAVARMLDDPAVVKAIQLAGGEKFPTRTREEAKRFLAAERSTWGNLIRLRKIKAD